MPTLASNTIFKCITLPGKYTKEEHNFQFCVFYLVIGWKKYDMV